MSLFHQDNESFFDYPMLRAAARKGIEDSGLIMRATNGESVPIRLTQTPTTCSMSRRTTGRGGRRHIEKEIC